MTLRQRDDREKRIERQLARMEGREIGRRALGHVGGQSTWGPESCGCTSMRGVDKWGDARGLFVTESGPES